MALRASKGMYSVTYGNSLKSCGVTKLFQANQKAEAEAFYSERVTNAFVKSHGPQGTQRPGPNHGKLRLVLQGNTRFNDSWVILQKITQGWGQNKKGEDPGIKSRTIKRRHFRNGKQFRKSMLQRYTHKDCAMELHMVDNFPMVVVMKWRKFETHGENCQFMGWGRGVRFDHQTTVKWLFLMGYLGAS